MAISFDDLERRPGFFAASKPQQVTFLPEPERRPRHYTLISVDDHLVEPPHMFRGRVPAVRVAGPRVELDDDGMEYWRYDGARHYKVGLNGGGAAARGGELRALALRRDAARRGTSMPGCTTWT